MEDSSNKESIGEAVRRTIDGNASMVQKWIAGQPGSWGFLAGKAVTATRQTLGRKLTDWERRVVWHLLWESLVELKR